MMSDKKIPSIIAEVIELVIDNDIEKAKIIIESIDGVALLEERNILRDQATLARKSWNGRYGETPKRKDVSPKKKKEIYFRDNYTCCYCQRKTIDLDVLKTLSLIIPEVLPYEPSWRMDKCHPIYWIFSASLEHLKPVADGGTNDDSNLRAACYLCNDKKNDLPLDILGWHIHRTDHEEWDGLTGYLYSLKELVPDEKYRKNETENNLTIFMESKRMSTLTIGSLVRMKLPNKKTNRKCKVELNDLNQVVLREMWQEGDDRNWVESKNTNVLQVTEIFDYSVLSEVSPELE